jgi:hypothetical protein
MIADQFSIDCGILDHQDLHKSRISDQL